MLAFFLIRFLIRINSVNQCSIFLFNLRKRKLDPLIVYMMNREFQTTYSRFFRLDALLKLQTVLYHTILMEITFIKLQSLKQRILSLQIHSLH
jgi:hypothetical protein